MQSRVYTESWEALGELVYEADSPRRDAGGRRRLSFERARVQPLKDTSGFPRLNRRWPRRLAHLSRLPGEGAAAEVDLPAEFLQAAESLRHGGRDIGGRMLAGGRTAELAPTRAFIDDCLGRLARVGTLAGARAVGVRGAQPARRRDNDARGQPCSEWVPMALQAVTFAAPEPRHKFRPGQGRVKRALPRFTPLRGGYEVVRRGYAGLAQFRHAGSGYDWQSLGTIGYRVSRRHDTGTARESLASRHEPEAGCLACEEGSCVPFLAVRRRGSQHL